MEKFVLILFSLMALNLPAQEVNMDSLIKANKLKKLALNQVIGTWLLKDSMADKIEFVKDSSSYLIIKPVKHCVNYYGFSIAVDSISVIGFAPNWPPYYCLLNLIDENTLQLRYYQYKSKSTSDFVYRRQKD